MTSEIRFAHRALPTGIRRLFRDTFEVCSLAELETRQYDVPDDDDDLDAVERTCRATLRGADRSAPALDAALMWNLQTLKPTELRVVANLVRAFVERRNRGGAR
ncbi:MAG: hypothetical protein ACRD15_07715 [Vicinamibacterales bacterium]